AGAEERLGHRLTNSGARRRRRPDPPHRLTRRRPNVGRRSPRPVLQPGPGHRRPGLPPHRPARRADPRYRVLRHRRSSAPRPRCVLQENADLAAGKTIKGRVSSIRPFLLLSFALLAILFTSPAAHGQKKDKPSRKTVAVLIFEGVELLDFAGPAEVFIV